MLSFVDRFLIFLRRTDKGDILKRLGFWCWTNVGRAMWSLVPRPTGHSEPRLRLAPWPQGNYFVLNLRMGYFRRHQIVRTGTPPCIAGVRIDFLHQLTDRNCVLPPGMGEWAKTPGRYLLLDMSGESLEPLDSSTAVERLAGLRDMLIDTAISPSQVILLNANAAAANYLEQLKHQHRNQAPGFHILGYHFYFFLMHFEAMCNPWFVRCRRLVRDVAERTVRSGELRPRHFMSLNLKDRPHRFVLLLHLIDRGHFHKGWVSYFADGQHAPHLPPDEEQMALLNRLPWADRLRRHIPELLERRPIALGGIESDLHEEVQKRQLSGSFSWMIPELRLQNGELTQYLSYFEIVTETYLGSDDVLYITEKTVRPIVRLQPFILIGPPFVLRELRRLGFKTFSPWIDEAYDEIVDPVARIEAALREVDRLCAMPLAELHQIYCEMWPIIAHNFDRYTDYPTIRQLYGEETSNYVVRPLHRICAGGHDSTLPR